MLSIAFAEEKNIGDHSATDGITHNDYKTIFSQWHLKLGSAAVGCLKSSEYMHTRSALIVLSRIVLVYPTQPKVGDKFLSMLETLQADESRPDIRATAQGYASQLGKARDDGMWKEENIAVTKARQEKEQMLLEERRKKHAQQHEDIRKETEKINREIGDGRDGRDYNRRGGRDDMRGRPWPSHQVSLFISCYIWFGRILNVPLIYCMNTSSGPTTTSEFSRTCLCAKRWRPTQRTASCTSATRWSRPWPRPSR